MCGIWSARGDGIPAENAGPTYQASSPDRNNNCGTCGIYEEKFCYYGGLVNNNGYAVCVNTIVPPNPTTYFEVTKDKTCHSDHRVGGDYDFNTPETCRNKCISSHFEGYFTLVPTSDSMKCFCFTDCDEDTREVAQGTVIYEILSDHISDEFREQQIEEYNQKWANQLAKYNIKLALKKRDTEITGLEDTITEKDRTIAARDQTIVEKDEKIDEVTAEKNKYQSMYDYVENNINGRVEDLFDSAESKYATRETEVGVNCGQINNAESATWFRSIFQLTAGVMVGAAAGFYVANQNKAGRGELESLL